METVLEHILISSYKAGMISYLKSHPGDFDEAIKLAISDKQPYSRRAAWLLWSCMEINDRRVKGYSSKIVDSLTTQNDGQLRELFIILQKLELNAEDEGKLFAICANVWEKISKKPSVRYHAFKMLVKMAKKHPDLSNEVILLAQIQYVDTLSDTVKRSVFRMIEELKP